MVHSFKDGFGLGGVGGDVGGPIFSFGPGILIPSLDAQFVKQGVDLQTRNKGGLPPAVGWDQEVYFSLTTGRLDYVSLLAGVQGHPQQFLDEENRVVPALQYNLG